MWTLSKGSGSNSPTSQSTTPTGLFRFMPFGTSPAVSRAGDFDGKVRKTIKQFTTPWSPPSASHPDQPPISGSLNEVPTDEEPFEVFVGGLRELGDNIDEEELQDHFKQFGEVVKLELTRDRRRHDQRGFCFVTYASKASAIACLEFKDHTIRGKSIAVEKAIRDSNSTKTKKRSRRSRRNQRAGSNIPQNVSNDQVSYSLAQPDPKHFFSWSGVSSIPSHQSIPSMANTPSRPTRFFNISSNLMNPTCAEPGYIYSATQPSTPVTASHQQWNFSLANHDMDVQPNNIPMVDRSFSQRGWSMGKDSMIHQLYSGWRSSYFRNHDQRLYEVEEPPLPSHS